MNFEKAETRACKLVMPDCLNDHESLFGGQIMKWMDELAYIAATRLTHKRMVTVSVSNLNFLKAVEQHHWIEIIARPMEYKGIRLRVQVDIYMESMYESSREKACQAEFVFVATHKTGKVIRIRG